MTGNTKIWRAPLAGLASLAMIATMGMAAATANATAGEADEVILDANNGVFSNHTADTSATKLTVPNAGNTTTWQDDLYYGTSNVNKPTRGGYTFSGWYTTKKGGSAVDPNGDIADGTTLYAHWVSTASANDSTVTFDLGTYVKAPTAVGDVVTAAGTVLLASGDTLADWQVPSEDAAVDDHQLFEGVWQKDGKDVAVKDMKGGQKYTPKTENATVVSYYAGNGVTVAKTLDGAKEESSNPTDSAAVKREYKQGSTFTPLSFYGGSASDWTNLDVAFSAGTANSDGTVTLPTGSNDVTATVSTAKNKVTYVMLTTYNNADSPVKDKVAMVQKGWTADPSKLFEAPTEVGSTFMGWSNEAMKTSRDESNLIKAGIMNADLPMYPWFKTDSSVTISFDLNYDNADVIDVDADANGYVEAPADPVRDGYTFVGWFDTEASTGGNEFKPAASYDESDVYYARWHVLDSTYKKATKDLSNETDVFTKNSLTAYAKAYNTAAKKYDLTGDPNGSKLSGDELTEATEAFQAAQALLVVKSSKTAAVYRVYNKADNKHLYTSNYAEAMALVAGGWRDEGIAYYTLNEVGDPESSTLVTSGLYIPVYRLYDKPANRHFYTKDKSEMENLVKSGWRDEGVAYYARTQGGVAVYRAYSPSRYEHLFTTSEAEYEAATTAQGEGWYRAENIAFYTEK